MIGPRKTTPRDWRSLDHVIERFVHREANLDGPAASRLRAVVAIGPGRRTIPFINRVPCSDKLVQGLRFYGFAARSINMDDITPTKKARQKKCHQSELSHDDSLAWTNVHDQTGAAVDHNSGHALPAPRLHQFVLLHHPGVDVESDISVTFSPTKAVFARSPAFACRAQLQ